MKTSDMILVGVLSLLIISVANFTLITNKYLDSSNSNNPASITLTLLKSNCDKCEILGDFISQIKGSNVKVKTENSEDFGSLASKNYISKYGIKKLPAIIVKGKTDQLNLTGFTKKNDALVLETPTAPYFDVASESVVGKVNIINIKATSCTDCSDLGVAINFLDQNGVYVENTQNVEYEDASNYISQYGIENVPAIVIVGDMTSYGAVYQTLQKVSKESDGYMVIQPAAPYLELSNNKIRGLVDITYLNDSSCTDCYDVKIHDGALSNLGIFIKNKSTYDIASLQGSALVEKYNITDIPTIILTGDLEAYNGFDQVWSSVGTVESDGAYIFRQMDQLGGAKSKHLE